MAKNKRLVRVTWLDDKGDWLWFLLMGVMGEWVRLKGVDDPTNGDRHNGSVIWAHNGDIREIEEYRP